MPYTGLRSYFPSLGDHFRHHAHKREVLVLNVREGGMRTYVTRLFSLFLGDEHRLERLVQSVRADMAQRDARIGANAIVLADGVSGAPITSTAALDRVIARGRSPTLVYKVDNRPAAAPTALPPIARRIGAPLNVPITPESRLEKLRTSVVAQLSASLGASPKVPELSVARAEARRVLTDNRNGLRAIGIVNPVHQANLIAADLAAAVRNVDERALTAANAPRVFALALNKSPVWAAIECKMAPACKAKPVTPVYVDDDSVADDDEPEETPAQLMARIGATVGAVAAPLPITYISSAVPAISAQPVRTSAMASIGTHMAAAAAPAAPAVDILAQIGFRVHTAADYTVEEVHTIEPIGGEACNSCQTIGHRYRCGKRCRRHYRRLEEKRAFDAAHGVPAAKLGSEGFVPVPGAPSLEFKPIAASIEPTITFRAPLQFRPVAAEVALESRPIAAEVALETRPIAAAVAAAAPINLREPQPVRVTASAPAGFRVYLRDADNSETLVGGAVAMIQPGPRHIVVENAAGKKGTATQTPLHFHAGQTHTINVENAGGSTSWKCTVSDSSAAIGAAYGAALAAHTEGLVLLHTDGTATSAPIGAWAAATNDEHEVAAASGRSYIFDAKRAFVADAANRMHPVLAVAKHPTSPNATVVLLPPITLPASN